MDALFENRTGVTRKKVQKKQGGRHELTMEPSMLAGWQYACMYNIHVRTQLKIYISLTQKYVRHKCSRLLPRPSPRVVNYSSCNNREGDACIKQWFERVLEKESVMMFLADFSHSTRYECRYSLHTIRI